MILTGEEIRARVATGSVVIDDFDPARLGPNSYNLRLAPELLMYTDAVLDPTTGEFNFSASEAYIIRDGKIAEPVKGCTLIGRGDQILLNIDRVGNDLELGQGMCGAASGSIPVNVGQPTIRISKITVGGRGGKLE